MNKGEIVWQKGERRDPEGRQEFRAEGAGHPATGGTRPVALVTKTLLLTAEGWGGSPFFRANDKSTGEVVAEVALPGHSRAAGR